MEKQESKEMKLVSEILSMQDPLYFLQESERILGEDFNLAQGKLRTVLQEAKQRASARESEQRKEVLTWLRNAITSCR